MTLGGGADDGAPGEGRRLERRGATAAPAPTAVGSGADDALPGLGGKDTLDGGAGADAFLAGADNDVVNASDGRRDALISCGGGKDA